MKKILYTTPILQYPATGGPQISVATCVKALNKISELHIISRVSLHNMGGIQGQRYFKNYCTKFLYSPSADISSNKYVKTIQRIWNNRIRKNADRHLIKDVNFILDYFDKYSMDMIWCDRAIESSSDLIYKIKLLRPDIKVIADTCAVYSKFILRELPFQKDQDIINKIKENGEAFIRKEKMLVNTANVTTAVSEVDAKYFRTIADEPKRIMQFSNVVDTDNYKSANKPISGIQKPSIYLAGSFYGNNSPMEHGARWTINKILPIIIKSIPNIHLYIVGRGSDKVLFDVENPNITITGTVPSVLPYLCNSDVAIVPLSFESGTRFKILEAGAATIPVVSTTLGAEGILVEDGKNILIADDENSFAEAIIKLITNKDRAKQIAEELNKLILRNYSIDSLSNEAKDIIEYVCENNK